MYVKDRCSQGNEMRETLGWKHFLAVEMERNGEGESDWVRMMKYVWGLVGGRDDFSH